MQFVQGFHLLATAFFVLGSAVVGLRLLWLATRTRETPELFLGGAIILTAVLGYGVLIVNVILRSSLTSNEVPGSLVFLAGFGKICHDVGVSLFLAFVAQVFRPGVAWARGLAGSAILLLWIGLVWGGLLGSFRTDNSLTPAWWCEYAVIWTYSLWLAVESFRYWGLLRKRTALGLADPMVCNRFLLWGCGSVLTFAATMIASIPVALLGNVELLKSLTPMIYVGTAIAGVGSISCSYLAFLPPKWLARRVRGHASEASEA
jgi:hypothetical protein